MDIVFDSSKLLRVKLQDIMATASIYDSQLFYHEQSIKWIEESFR